LKLKKFNCIFFFFFVFLLIWASWTRIARQKSTKKPRFPDNVRFLFFFFWKYFSGFFLFFQFLKWNFKEKGRGGGDRSRNITEWNYFLWKIDGKSHTKFFPYSVPRKVNFLWCKIIGFYGKNNMLKFPDEHMSSFRDTGCQSGKFWTKNQP